MRITIDITEDAILAARQMARCARMSLGDAISELVRRGATAGSKNPLAWSDVPLRGRFALLLARGEVVTPQQVRKLMEREGI